MCEWIGERDTSCCVHKHEGRSNCFFVYVNDFCYISETCLYHQ